MLSWWSNINVSTPHTWTICYWRTGYIFSLVNKISSNSVIFFCAEDPPGIFLWCVIMVFPWPFLVFWPLPFVIIVNPHFWVLVSLSTIIQLRKPSCCVDSGTTSERSALQNMQNRIKFEQNTWNWLLFRLKNVDLDNF